MWQCCTSEGMAVYLGLARTIYIRCICGIFGREITKYTVIYGAYFRFWPTLRISVCTVYMTIYSVVSLPTEKYILRIHMVLANPICNPRFQRRAIMRTLDSVWCAHKACHAGCHADKADQGHQQSHAYSMWCVRLMHAVLGGMQTRLTRFTDNLMFNLCGLLFMRAVLGVMKIRLTGATKGHALLKKKADALTLKFRFVAVSAFYPAIGMESAASRSVALNFQHLLLFKKADVLQQRI